MKENSGKNKHRENAKRQQEQSRGSFVPRYDNDLARDNASNDRPAADREQC